MAIKYDIKNILIDIAERENQEIVILQGETIGNVQGNPYKLSENKFYCYNLIFTNEAKGFYIKKDPIEGKKYIEEHPEYEICGDVKHLQLESSKYSIIDNLLLAMDDIHKVDDIYKVNPVYLKDLYK